MVDICVDAMKGYVHYGKLVLRLVRMTQAGQRATWKPSFDAKPWPASTVIDIVMEIKWWINIVLQFGQLSIHVHRCCESVQYMEEKPFKSISHPNKFWCRIA